MAEFAQVLIRAKDETKTAFDSASKNMRGLQADASRLNSLLGALGVGVSVAGLAAFAKSGIDAADALNDLSARTGVGVKTLADYKLAATLADTSLDSLAKGIQRLTLSIGQAEAGGKVQAKALQTLGISARDPQQAFEQLADAVANSNDPIRTNAALNDVLGRSYTELLPLLQGGAKGLRDSAAASASFSDAMVRLAPDAAKLNDQLDVLRNNIAGVAANVLSRLVPSFNEWIAVGQEVVKTGSLLDKVRFFALGNASDEMVGRVRKMAAEAAAAAKKSREAIGKINAPNTIAEPAKKTRATARVASDPLASLLGSTDIGKLAAFDKTVAQLNARFDGGRKNTELYTQAMTKLVETTFSANFTEFNKQLAEQEETQRLVDEHLKSTTDELREQDQAWIDAGKAIEEQYKPGLVQLEERLGYLDELFRRNLISAEALSAGYADAFDSVGKSTDKAASEMDSFAKTAAENIQNSFADFLFDPFDKGLKGMLQGFGHMVQRMIADAVAARLLFGDLSKGGSGDGAVGGWLKAAGTLFGFADGGVAAYGRPVALPRFAGGGVSNSAAIFGEAGPEAAVPLPDGRHIPVKMMGGGGNTYIVNVNGSNNAPDVRRAAGQGMREALGMMNGAQRYA